MARPQLHIEALGCTGEPGRWHARFRVSNRGATPVSLSEGWLPHGRFRAERTPFDPPLPLAAGEAVELGWPVAVDGSEGVVENAFLILRVEAEGEPWRLFARIRVELSPDGTPLPRVVQVSVDGATLGPGGEP